MRSKFHSNSFSQHTIFYGTDSQEDTFAATTILTFANEASLRRAFTDFFISKTLTAWVWRSWWHVGKRFWMSMGITFRINGIPELLYNFFLINQQRQGTFLVIVDMKGFD